MGSSTDLLEIKRKIVSSFVSLTFRRAALYAIRFFTINIILARLLGPSITGVFNIANSILAFFAYFSDIGLAGAIIQKKELSHDDLKTTFTIQESLALLIFLIIFFAAPALAQSYNLDQSGVFLIRALAFSFLLSSLKVLPSVLLERDLNFGRLVLVEIVETTVFCLSLIWLSFNNFGVNAFSYSALLQSLSGVTLIYLIAPLRVSFGFSKPAAKALLNFGVPFQLNSLLALLKDRLVPLVVARMVGATGVGYITWAQSLAFMPLEVMNIMTRITFPAFSRIQDDKPSLEHTLERSLFFTTLMLYPLLFGLLAIAPSLVEYVVSTKWRPALPLIYLFAVTVFWASLSTPFTNFLNAVGKIKISLKLMIMWTALEWSTTPLLTLFYSFYGVAIASFFISFSSIIPIFIIKRMISIEIMKTIWQQLLVSVVMAIVTYFLAQRFVTDLFSLLIIIFSGGIIYCVGIAVLMGKKIILEVRDFKNA